VFIHMVVTGVLIAESLEIEARLEGVTLTVRRIARHDEGDTDAGQPLTWTFIEFEAPLDEAEELAATLSRADRAQVFGLNRETPLPSGSCTIA
jgi:hypothetical protein